MKIGKARAVLGMLAFLGLGVAACDSGTNPDSALHRGENAVERGAENTGKAVERGIDNMHEGVDRARKNVGDALDNAGDAARGSGSPEGQ